MSTEKKHDVRGYDENGFDKDGLYDLKRPGNAPNGVVVEVSDYGKEYYEGYELMRIDIKSDHKYKVVSKHGSITNFKLARHPKKVELTDAERHKILLANVSAGKCVVSRESYNKPVNFWSSDRNVEKWKISRNFFTDSEPVWGEITDTLLIELMDGK